ncbi:hypothetical protein BD408DRAFT_418037 [Parasitella parasitica]|nr:hypothetical protein BD408DRAFT_418037 [Parasitella parasitica]
MPKDFVRHGGRFFEVINFFILIILRCNLSKYLAKVLSAGMLQSVNFVSLSLSFSYLSSLELNSSLLFHLFHS